MVDNKPTLAEEHHYPALHQSADNASIKAQKRFLFALRVRLGGLLVAATGGAISWSVGSVAIGGLVAFAAFAAALGSELYGAAAHPERAWYEGRAAAESVKTLTWRYAVKGEPFHKDDQVDKRFIAAANEVLQDLNDLDMGSTSGDANQISITMRSVRSGSFHDRRDAYIESRIKNQQRWYTNKSTDNKKYAERWLVASIVFEVLGLVAGGFRAFTSFDIDLLGILAALAATATAWLQAKQHQTLATAYAVTALELASVADEAEVVQDEESWGRFVDEAEEAISREHTLWRASRGVRIRTTRRRAT